MDIFNYRQKMEGLQAKIRQSEMARRELETKLQQMMRRQNECDKYKRRCLKDTYENFLEEEKLRLARNDRLLQTMEDIDYRAGTLAAKTERLKLLKSQYELYLTRTWSPTPAHHIQNPLIMEVSQTNAFAPVAAQSIVYKCPSLVNANQQSNIQLPQYYRHSNIDSCSTAPPYGQPQIILSRDSYPYDPTSRVIALGEPLTSAASCYPAPVQANNIQPRVELFNANNSRLLERQWIPQMDKLSLANSTTNSQDHLSADAFRPDPASSRHTTAPTSAVHVPNIIVSNVVGTTFRSTSPAGTAPINQSSSGWERSLGYFQDESELRSRRADDRDNLGPGQNMDKKRNTRNQLETSLSSGDPISTSSLGDNYYLSKLPEAVPSGSQDGANRPIAVNLQQGGTIDAKYVPGKSDDIIPASYRYLSLERNSDQMPSDSIGSTRTADNNQKSSMSASATLGALQSTTNFAGVSHAELENYAERLSGKTTTNTKAGAPNSPTTDHYFDDFVAHSGGSKRGGVDGGDALRHKDIPVYSSSSFNAHPTGFIATPAAAAPLTEATQRQAPPPSPRNGEIREAVHQKWEKIIEVDDKATANPLQWTRDDTRVTGNTTAEQDQFADRQGEFINDKWSIQQDQDESRHRYNNTAAVEPKSSSLKDYQDYGRQPDTEPDYRVGASTSEWEINSQSHTNYDITAPTAPELGQVKQPEVTYSNYHSDEPTDMYPGQQPDDLAFNEATEQPKYSHITNTYSQLHDVPEEPAEDVQFMESFAEEKTDMGNEKDRPDKYAAQEPLHSASDYPHMETRTQNITSTVGNETGGMLQQQFYAAGSPRSHSGSPTKTFAYEEHVGYAQNQQSPQKLQQLSREPVDPLTIHSLAEYRSNQPNSPLNQIVQAHQQPPLEMDQSYYAPRAPEAQETINPDYSQAPQDGDAQFNPEGPFSGEPLAEEFQSQDIATYQTPTDYPDTGVVDDYGGLYEESGYVTQAQSDYNNYLADATQGEYETSYTGQNYGPMDTSALDFNDDGTSAYGSQSKQSPYEHPGANYQGYYGGDQSYGEITEQMENPVNYAPTHGNYMDENAEINSEQSYYPPGDQQHLKYYPEATDSPPINPQMENSNNQQPDYSVGEQLREANSTSEKDLSSSKSPASLDAPPEEIIAPALTGLSKEKDKPKRPVKKVQILESTDSESQPKRGPASTGGVLKGGKSKRSDTSASDSSDFNFNSK